MHDSTDIHHLDTRGLRCPLPVRLTARRVAQLGTGEELTVVGDDPAMELDLEAWCFDHGHEVVERSREAAAEGLISCRIRVAAAEEPETDRPDG